MIHIALVLCESIDDTDSFEWIDNYFRSRYEVNDTEEHCMHAVEFEDFTFCYRDLKDSQSKAIVGIYIDTN